MESEVDRDWYIGLQVAHSFDLISLVKELSDYQTLISNDKNKAKETLNSTS